MVNISQLSAQNTKNRQVLNINLAGGELAAQEAIQGNGADMQSINDQRHRNLIARDYNTYRQSDLILDRLEALKALKDAANKELAKA